MHQERRLVKYSPDQIFDVVANIDGYSEFLPWCKESVITKQVGDKFQSQLRAVCAFAP